MTELIKLSAPTKQDTDMALVLTVPSQRVVEASTLPAIIEKYLAECERTVASEALRNYKLHLRPLLKWWTEHPDQHEHIISAATMDKFLSWLKTDCRNLYDEPLSDHTISKALLLTRQVLRWAHRQGGIAQDVSDLVPRHTFAIKEKYYPSIMELEELIKSPADPYLALRDQTIMAMLLATGARRFELANAQAENVHFNTPILNVNLGDDHGGYVRLDITKRKTHGEMKARYSLFDWKAGLLLKAYLRTARRKSGSIFGLTDEGIRNVVADAGERTGITAIHPHAFRSAFIDWWFWRHRTDGPAADMALRLQVGHSLQTDDAQVHYINRNHNRVLALIQEFYTSPLEDIKIDWWGVSVHCDEASRYR